VIVLMWQLVAHVKTYMYGDEDGDA